MRSTKTIHVISAHAEGEVGDVIVGGVLPPPGDTIWDQSRWIEKDDTLRKFVLNEPRGGVFRHVNLLVPPKHPDAVAAFIIMEPADIPPMSGSNSICVSTVLLDGGLVPMVEPETRMTLEAPGGLVHVPHLEGERTPNLPDATGSLLGMTLTSMSRENLARAAVEGLLCLMGVGADAVRAQGVAVDRVTLVGGAARSRAVREIAPMVLGVPVDVPAPGEYVADGAARQAAWVLSGASEPPAWNTTEIETYEAAPTPRVREAYDAAAAIVARR